MKTISNRIIWLMLSVLAMTLGCKADVIPVANVPEPTTKEATEITRTSAMMNGSVSNPNSASITEFGFLFGTDNNLSDATKYAISGDMSSFSQNVTGLNGGSSYFYAVYVTNGISTIQGRVMSINTVSSTAATLTKTTVSSEDYSTWTFSSSISDNGGSEIVQVGFCYGASPNPSTTDSDVVYATVPSTGGSAFSAPVGPDKYKPGTTYYVRAFAECDLSGTGSSTISYSSEQAQFNTLSVKPSVTTSNPDEGKILSATAEVGGNVISDGGAVLTGMGIVYSISENPTVEDAQRKDAETYAAGPFTVTLSGLSIKTTYYYRAFAINHVGISYGEQNTFTTLEGKPSVTTRQVYRISGSSATVEGEVLDKGTSEILECGIVWSTEDNPTIDDFCKEYPNPGVGVFDVTISENLRPKTTYYVRAYATNSSGTSYGQSLNFSLKEDVPVLSIDAPTNISSTSAGVSATITDDYGSSITERGFVFSDTEKNPTTSTSSVVNAGSGSGSFSSTLTDLMAGKTYYVRAYAINNSGEGYSSAQSFTTESSTPTVMTIDASSVTENYASLEGEITNVGGESIIERGFYFGMTPNPKENGSKYNVLLKDLHFSKTFSSLETQATYYYVAYAINSKGEGLGKEKSFTTKRERPKVTTGAVADVNKTSVSCTGNATSAGGGTVTERGFVISPTNSTPTVNDRKINCGNGLGQFSASIADLNPGTLYYICAYVMNEDWNGNDTQYGEVKSFMTHAEGGTEDYTDNIYEW